MEEDEEICECSNKEDMTTSRLETDALRYFDSIGLHFEDMRKMIEVSENYISIPLRKRKDYLSLCFKVHFKILGYIYKLSIYAECDYIEDQKDPKYETFKIKNLTQKKKIIENEPFEAFFEIERLIEGDKYCTPIKPTEWLFEKIKDKEYQCLNIFFTNGSKQEGKSNLIYKWLSGKSSIGLNYHINTKKYISPSLLQNVETLDIELYNSTNSHLLKFILFLEEKILPLRDVDLPTLVEQFRSYREKTFTILRISNHIMT